MMRTCILTIALLSILTMSGKSYSQDEFLGLKGPYLGQEPPGLIPRAFAPGIVSTEEHLETEVLFSPDMTELSFTRSGGKYKEPVFLVMHYENNKWSKKPVPSIDINK